MKVDVLAVMDEWANGKWDSCEEWGAHLMRHAEARAAVVELIDAAIDFMREEPAATVSEMTDQLDRLRAALSKVQP